MARGGLAQVLGSGLPSTRQLLESFGPLAQSVAAAHRHGLALGCAHPSRIRLAEDGRLEMAITPTPRGATMDQDVQGLGAVLYALLTGCWPLSANETELGGLPRAPRDQFGVAVAPALVRHGLAPELSALAMAALGAGLDRSHARVRTAAAIGRVVGDLRAEWSSEVLPPRDHAEVGQRELWRADSDGAVSRDPDTARKLSLGMAGLALGTLAVLCFLGYQAASMLGLGPPSAPRVVVGADIPPIAAPPIAVPPANVVSANAGSPANVAVVASQGDSRAIAPLAFASLVFTPRAVAPLGGVPMGSVPLDGVPTGSVPMGVVPLGIAPPGFVPLGFVPPAATDGTGAAPNASTGAALTGAAPTGNAPAQPLTRLQPAGPPAFGGQYQRPRGYDKDSAKDSEKKAKAKAKKRQRDSSDDSDSSDD